jgi:hypothetical protein
VPIFFSVDPILSDASTDTKYTVEHSTWIRLANASRADHFLLTSIFLAFFDLIIWAIASFRMRRADFKAGWVRHFYRDGLSMILSIFVIVVGLAVLGLGIFCQVKGP